ncbi:MAG: phosphate signaling complex protein PhoU [Kiritimatiellae bacterium]|nr:phosphate signaling complex protein PhoU [Kiritimatiellia bacterium]
MDTHLQHEIERLKRDMLAMGTLVEENLRQAVHAVLQKDSSLAVQVAERDTPIDLREVDIEEECLKNLALYQPVAKDLRFIIGVLKLNGDLERIGDKAVKIAERADDLSVLPSEASPDFRPMADRVLRMLKESLDALVHLDEARARRVCEMDDEMDQLYRTQVQQIKEGLRKFPAAMEGWLAGLTVARAFERIADHCTNIAEDVIYQIKGVIVRHEASRKAAAGSGSGVGRP